MVPRGVIPHVLQQLLGVCALPVDAAARELEFLNAVLCSGVKDHHTWSYRQCILVHFNDEPRLWAGVERGEQHTAMVPDLVRFQGDRDAYMCFSSSSSGTSRAIMVLYLCCLRVG
ncbi:hypothetical protein C8Q74DRAFT_224667 [Fomes fomentarius]|nr:hypothetical protein C8Q74DRAFT_224667 [Fomes fomentarius]